MDPLVLTLLIVNALLLPAFGWPLARRLSRTLPASWSAATWMLALGAVYLAECAAFSASMATNVLSVCLAVVWGLVLGRKARTLPFRSAIRLSLRFSWYTSLPAVSFLSLLGPLAWNGWSLLAAEDGRRFGIPASVPWPACTILGFLLAVSGSAVVLKTAITTGIAAVLIRRTQRTRTPPGRAAT